jgi:hypothetical protein
MTGSSGTAPLETSTITFPSRFGSLGRSLSFWIVPGASVRKFLKYGQSHKSPLAVARRKGSDFGVCISASGKPAS